MEKIYCKDIGREIGKSDCWHSENNPNCTTCPELNRTHSNKKTSPKLRGSQGKTSSKYQGKDKTPDKSTYKRKEHIEGTLSKAGIDISFSVSLTKEDWQRLSLLYFEDDGRSAEQFYNDFYTSFMMPAKYTINKGMPGRHKGSLFCRTLKVQAAILYKHFEILKKERKLEAYLKSYQIKNKKRNLTVLTMDCMKKVYNDWVKELGPKKPFDDELSFAKGYINEGKKILAEKNNHLELSFIRTILKTEKNIQRLKSKQIDRYCDAPISKDRYNNEPIFKFVYDLMASYRIF